MPDPPPPACALPPPPARPARTFVFLNSGALDRLEAGFELGLPLKDCCALAGITVATFRRWERLAEQGHRDYAAAFAELAWYMAAGRWNRLQAIVGSKQWRAHAWVLARNDRETWGRQADLPAAPDDPAQLAGSFRFLMDAARKVMDPGQYAEFLGMVEGELKRAEGTGEGGDDGRGCDEGDREHDEAGGLPEGDDGSSDGR